MFCFQLLRATILHSFYTTGAKGPPWQPGPTGVQFWFVGKDDEQAFLYGEGDFKKTMGISIASGFDCDNQAATLAGLLGVMHGGSAIPKDLTHEIAGNNWTEPFNNKYVNLRRPPLDPVYTNSEIIDKARIPKCEFFFLSVPAFLCCIAC